MKPTLARLLCEACAAQMGGNPQPLIELGYDPSKFKSWGDVDRLMQRAYKNMPPDERLMDYWSASKTLLNDEGGEQ